MKRTSAFLFISALAVTLSAQSARASFVPWTYNWTPSVTSIPADSPGTGGLSLTNEPTNHAVGTSDVVITNIRTFSSAPRTAPDKVTHGAYSFNLFLQDDGSGQHTTMSFSGFFSGAMSVGSANVANHFTGVSQQTVTLGGHKYIVQLGSYAPPGPPTASNAGSLTAHVFVDEVPDQGGGNGGGGTSGHDAPEPSTLLLSVLGLSGLSAGAWRKFVKKA